MGGEIISCLSSPPAKTNVYSAVNRRRLVLGVLRPYPGARTTWLICTVRCNKSLFKLPWLSVPCVQARMSGPLSLRSSSSFVNFLLSLILRYRRNFGTSRRCVEFRWIRYEWKDFLFFWSTPCSNDCANIQPFLFQTELRSTLKMLTPAQKKKQLSHSESCNLIRN